MSDIRPASNQAKAAAGRMSEWIAVEAMIVELINTYTRAAQQVFKAFSPWRIQALRELNPGRLPR